MAPHDTNTPKEARRHAVPLIGLAVVLAFVLLLFVGWIWNVTRGPEEVEPGSLTEQQPATPEN
jgi:hypothetical protein